MIERKVKILVEFVVRSVDDDMTENQAKTAASLAAHESLQIDPDEVTPECAVWVDGYGTAVVRLGEDHE